MLPTKQISTKVKNKQNENVKVCRISTTGMENEIKKCYNKATFKLDKDINKIKLIEDSIKTMSDDFDAV